VGFCLLLLLWIFPFHFSHERRQNRRAKQRTGLEPHGRSQQWSWRGATGAAGFVAHAAFDPSGGAAGVFPAGGIGLVVGVVRWRIVLEAQGIAFAVGPGHAHLVCGAVFQFVPARIHRRRLDQGLLRGAGNASQENRGGDDGVRGPVGGIVGHAVVRLSDDDSQLRHVAGVARCGIAGAFHSGDAGRIERGAGAGVLGRRFQRFPAGARLFAPVAQRRGAGTRPGFVPPIRKQKSFLLKTIAISLLVNVIWVVQIIVLGQGLGLDIPPMALFVIVPVIFCISALPITPNGLGVRENLFVLMLAGDQSARTAALSVSLIASAQGLFWSLVGGLIYMGLREKEHLSEVTQGGEDAKESLSPARLLV
jgi:hypothetical protein